MPRTSFGAARILRSHPTRKWRPDAPVLRQGKIPTVLLKEKAPFVGLLLRGRHPVAHAHFVKLYSELSRAHDALPRGEDFREDFGESRRTWEKALSRWMRYTRKVLHDFPDVKRRFISKLIKENDPLTGTQITMEGRHMVTDQHLLELLTERKLHPTSFLDVGVAFNSRSTIEPFLHDRLAPLREVKSFFDSKDIPMNYVGADIADISKNDQRDYLKEGISTISWDYRTRPLMLKGKVRQFSIIRLANTVRHQSKKEFRSTLEVLFKSLEPNGILIIKNLGDDRSDEVFYQKQKVRGKWELRPLAKVVWKGFNRVLVRE